MSMRLTLLASAAYLASVCASAPAWAIPVELSFTANFPAGSPQTTVTGDFSYNAASVTSPITSLTSVNMTIAGHAYTLGELGFETIGSGELIGTTGPPAGLGSAGVGFNSFFFEYFPSTGTPADNLFFYGTSSDTTGSLSVVSSYSQFSVTAVAAVPEPASWVLFLTALFGAGVFAHCAPRLGRVFEKRRHRSVVGVVSAL
jgi:hypothetical protein